MQINCLNRIERVLPVIDQIKTAVRSNNRVASTFGFMLGGFVPIATFFVAHYEVDASKALYQQIHTLLVIGGLFFSAKTVYDWAKTAFRHPMKALGFVILIEGVMTFSNNNPLAIAALCYLVVINGIATACNLVLDQRKAKVR